MGRCGLIVILQSSPRLGNDFREISGTELRCDKKASTWAAAGSQKQLTPQNGNKSFRPQTGVECMDSFSDPNTAFKVREYFNIAHD